MTVKKHLLYYKKSFARIHHLFFVYLLKCSFSSASNMKTLFLTNFLAIKDFFLCIIAPPKKNKIKNFTVNVFHVKEKIDSLIKWSILIYRTPRFVI